MNHHQLGLAAAALAASFAGAADAASITNVASGSVAVVSNGSTGQVFNTLQLDSNANRSNYMVFDVSSLASLLGGLDIGSATLTITNPGSYGNISAASETFELWSFDNSVSINTLRNYTFGSPPNAATAAAVRDDLRSGTSYGSTVIATPGGSGSLAPAVSVTLNAAAIAALNGAIDSAAQYFAIGGYADLGPTNEIHYLFTSSTGGAYGAGNASLDLQPVPVPAAVWLLGSAVMSLGAARRRRRAA